MTTSPALSLTRASGDDRAAVQACLNEYAAAWAAGDAERMYRTATDDVEWINIVGMHWRGKAAVVAAHEAYLTTIFRGVPLTLREIESLRSVGPDVVLAVVRWSVGQFTTPTGHIVPDSEDRMTLVFQRSPDGLRLSHGANIQIDQAAAASDPIQRQPSG